MPKSEALNVVAQEYETVCDNKLLVQTNTKCI